MGNTRSILGKSESGRFIVQFKRLQLVDKAGKTFSVTDEFLLRLTL